MRMKAFSVQKSVHNHHPDWEWAKTHVDSSKSRTVSKDRAGKEREDVAGDNGGRGYFREPRLQERNCDKRLNSRKYFSGGSVALLLWSRAVFLLTCWKSASPAAAGSHAVLTASVERIVASSMVVEIGNVIW